MYAGHGIDSLVDAARLFWDLAQTNKFDLDLISIIRQTKAEQLQRQATSSDDDQERGRGTRIVIGAYAHGPDAARL
jgi:hypothetical protein